MDKDYPVITEEFLGDASDDELRAAVRERQAALTGETLLTLDVAVIDRLSTELAFLHAELGRRRALLRRRSTDKMAL